jgi:hypothetical protein
MDTNMDGKLSVDEFLEVPLDFLSHSSLFLRFTNGIRNLFTTNFINSVTILYSKISKLMSPIDFIIISMILLSYKKVLYFIYKLTHPFVTDESNNQTKPYKYSLIGFLEKPISFLVYFPFFLYVVDVISLTMNHFGVKLFKKTDLPKVSCTLFFCFIIGSFITKIKDWFFNKFRTNFKNRLNSSLTNGDFSLTARDLQRENITDELISTMVWFFVGFDMLKL